jgi:hypothetical protein
MDADVAPPQEIRRCIEKLLETGIVSIQPCAQGKNNQSFVVTTRDGKVFAKRYFRSSGDERNRLDTEFRFLSFLWEGGIRSVPMPLASDAGAGIACYSYLDATPVTGPVFAADVAEAAHFYASINHSTDADDGARSRKASALPLASEAAFSIPEHLLQLNRRIERLPVDTVPAELADRYTDLSQDVLPRLAARCTEKLRDQKLQRDLFDGQRRLSPSDFGFHNALRAPDGRLLFVDFEYAGWDDPARTVCDFFLQPRIPPPPDAHELFLEEGFPDAEERDLIRKRIPHLYPLCALRWCCIILNVFLPVDRSRRLFAGQSLSLELLNDRLMLAEARAESVEDLLG